MTRGRRPTKQEIEILRTTFAVSEMARNKSPKSKRRINMKRASAELEDAYKTEDWSKATGRTFVALYIECHNEVYGVAPYLSNKELIGAASMASNMLKSQFPSPNEMAEFLRWVWKRERERDKWRCDNNRERTRLSWQVIFGHGGILTDWRVSKERR